VSAALPTIPAYARMPEDILTTEVLQTAATVWAGSSTAYGRVGSGGSTSSPVLQTSAMERAQEGLLAV
jgi:hypothetical protein